MRISDWSSDVCASDLLQTARAGEMGVRVSDEEIDNAISNIAAQNRLTPDQLRQQLASDGLSYDDFRRSLRDELLTQRLRQRFAQTRIRSEEHTSELQSLMRNSYAVFCLKKKKNNTT